jgi:hypothetical protein
MMNHWRLALALALSMPCGAAPAADGAFAGKLSQTELVGRLCKVHAVQCGGGVRSLDDVTRLLDVGVHRVVVGTAILTQPALLRQCLDAHGPDKGRARITYQHWRRGRHQADGAGRPTPRAEMVQCPQGGDPHHRLDELRARAASFA